MHVKEALGRDMDFDCKRQVDEYSGSSTSLSECEMIDVPDLDRSSKFTSPNSRIHLFNSNLKCSNATVIHCLIGQDLYAKLVSPEVRETRIWKIKGSTRSVESALLCSS